MTGYELERQLTTAIGLLVEEYPQGLSVLMGISSPPCSADIAELVACSCGASADLGVRVDGGETVYEAERVMMTADRFFSAIEAAGGWEHLAKVTKEWAERYATTWGIIVDHVRWVQGSYSRIDESQLDKLAEKHMTTTDTICRKKREFPRMLARAVLRTPVDGEEWGLGGYTK